jgi:aryl-alcohol dehydrogenase-like predicted oxidoreductase
VPTPTPARSVISFAGASTPEDSAPIIHKALDAGINFVDTADAYGDSEEVVGQALQGRRDDVVLATKFGRPTGQDPNHQGASRRWIVTAVENSLRRLRTDHIDLYQLHRPDPHTEIDETLAALTDLISSGKIRAIGASGTPAAGIVEARWTAERRGLAHFHTEQPAYSILSRGIERELLPTTQKFGMGTLVWGPLGQGLLTGRVRKNQPNDLRRAGLFRHLTDEHRLDAVEQLIPLAAEASLPMTHLAMAFHKSTRPFRQSNFVRQRPRDDLMRPQSHSTHTKPAHTAQTNDPHARGPNTRR